jgi:1-acyl-sn-glycerol-3-phosphate acyltransferase
LNQIAELTDILAREGAEALGWERGRRGGAVVRTLLRPAAQRIAREFAACDDVLASHALPDAARWILEHFSVAVESSGLDRVPRRGPILLVANHPGLTDAMGLIAALDRPDVRIVAADYPFLRAMRGLGPRLIFLGASGASQLTWIRAVIRDLRQGGVVLLFPAGRLEPDPAVLGPRGALLPWSESVGLIRRHAPDAQVVAAAVTGVLSRRAFAHPLTRVRRAPLDRQRVATLLQMVDPRSRKVTVRIVFGALIAPAVDADVNSQLARWMRQLIFDPRSDWTPLSRKRSQPLTTTAA